MAKKSNSIKDNTFQKLTYLGIGMFISIILMILITYIYMQFKNGVLFFSAFLIAILSSLLTFILWILKYKNKFEAILVFVCCILFNTLFIYLGPVTIDRSLSSFVYFYSVEKGKIQTDILKDEYFIPYVQRRFTDGQKIGFLKCNKNICEPTLKTKILYYTLYPLSKLTGTNKEYENFREFMNRIKSSTHF